MESISTSKSCGHCGSSLTVGPLWRLGVGESSLLCDSCGFYWRRTGLLPPTSMSASTNESFREPETVVDEVLAKVAANAAAARRKRKRLPFSGSAYRQDSRRKKKKKNQSMVADQSECKIKQRVDNGKGSRSHATSQMSLGVFIPSKHRHLLKSGLPVFPKQLPPSVGALKIQLIPASTTLTTESIDLDVPESGKTTVRYTVFRRKRLLFQGDHVVVRGSDESIYFGIIQNIFIGSLGDRRVLLRWLLPRPQFMSKIDGPPENICPTYFKLGPLQSRSESVEACIVDVFYSPVLIGLQRCRYYCDGFVNFDTKLYGDPESLFAPEESENKWRSNVLPPLPRTFSAPSVDTKDICVSEGTTKKFLENGPDYLELEKNKSLNAENQIKVKTIQQDVYLDSYQFSSSQKELGDGSKLNLDNSDTPVTLGLLSRETSNDDQPVIVTTPNDKAKRRSSRRRPSSVVSNPIDTDDGYLNVFSPSIVALSTVDSSVEVKAEDSDGVRPAVIVASIVEEVEMAHLLCSMFLS